MPILNQAKKALRADMKKRVFNDRRRNAMRTQMKAIKKLIEAGNKTEAQKLMPLVQKAIDKGVKGGILKKNTASRRKSRLVAAIKKIS